jgi:transposase InsO family protein
VIVDRPDRLWVADITYVAIAVGFVYVAVILDAWSRRVVGYAISRSIDARLTIAALKSAIVQRKPPPGCMHHSDRGSRGFKWSSQHIDGSCDEHSKTALGSFWAGAAARHDNPPSIAPTTRRRRSTDKALAMQASLLAGIQHESENALMSEGGGP